MPSHRSLRMAEAIREVVATAILFDVADPRVRSVTVLRVEVSGDLRYATVFRVDHGERERAKAVVAGPRPRDRLSSSSGGGAAANPVHAGALVQARRQRQEIGRAQPPDRRGRRIGPPQGRMNLLERLRSRRGTVAVESGGGQPVEVADPEDS